MGNTKIKEFLKSIYKEYVEARKIRVGNREAKRVIRGRSRSISSIAEDLFAKLLWREFKLNKIHIFVDQPISLGGKGKIYYPDIVICKRINKDEYEIFYMIDLKLDIGWHRNSFFKEINKLTSICNGMKRAKALKGKIGSVEDESKQSIKFKINSKATYDVVLISSSNSGKNENKLINASKDKNSNIWVLSTGGSLNQYKIKKEIELNEKDYNTLLSKIREVLQ